MSTDEKGPVVPTVVRDLILKSHEIQGWLGKLVDHADEAYPEVFERVRKDYTGRLDGVAQDLTKHRSDLLSDLEERRRTVESLRGDRDSHMADLEEVRLRHAVGELSEEDWDSRRTTIETARDEVDSVLSVEEDAVAELATVVDSIDRIVGSRKATPPIARVVTPRVEKKIPTVVHGDSWTAVLSGMAAENGKGDASEDELDFLESVSTDDVKGFREMDPIVAAMRDDE